LGGKKFSRPKQKTKQKNELSKLQRSVCSLRQRTIVKIYFGDFFQDCATLY
jgi:hypothetical protein